MNYMEVGGIMKYKNFMGRICIADAILDEYDKDEIKVSCNKVEDVPVLFFKDNEGKVLECIVLR